MTFNDDSLYNRSVLLLDPSYYTPQNDAFLSFHYFSPLPTWMRIIAVVICLFVMSFGGIGNLTVLAAFARNFRDRKRSNRASRNLWQRHYVNIVVLAVADVVLCLYSVPVVLTESALGYWMFPAWFCRVHWSITAWSYYGGMTLVMLVGYDRYLIVKHGVDYERIETWRTIVTRAMFFGVINSALGTIPLQYMNYIVRASVIDGSPAARGEPFFCFSENMLLGYIYPAVCFLGFFVPVLTMAYFYWKVHRYTQQHIRNRDAERANNRRPMVKTFVISAAPERVGEPKHASTLNNALPTTVLSYQHQRATKILKYLFTSITIFYFPYALATFMVLLIMTGVAPNLDLEWWTYFLHLSQIIGVINNALNPLLYAYTMPALNETMADVWKDSTRWAFARFVKRSSAGTGKQEVRTTISAGVQGKAVVS